MIDALVAFAVGHAVWVAGAVAAVALVAGGDYLPVDLAELLAIAGFGFVGGRLFGAELLAALVQAVPLVEEVPL